MTTTRKVEVALSENALKKPLKHKFITVIKSNNLFTIKNNFDKPIFVWPEGYNYFLVIKPQATKKWYFPNLPKNLGITQVKKWPI